MRTGLLGKRLDAVRVWIRFLAIGLAMVGTAAAAPLLVGGTIAVNSMCGTSFGSCSYAVPDPADNGLQSGQLAWFENHFGALARVSANSTSGTGSDQAVVRGNYWTDLLIPAQTGLTAGELVTFEAPFQLDGTIGIDYGDNFYVIGGQQFNATSTAIDFVWSSIIGTSSGQQGTQYLEDRHYANNNHQTDTIHDNVTVRGQVVVGEVFQLYQFLDLEVRATSALSPSVGFAQADFSHTAIMGPAIVLDSSGHPVSNPIILSASGLDYSNPQASAVAAPEPASLAVVLLGGAALLTMRHRKL